MYQSLHTTVIGPFGERMEVQIRTDEMHRIAEEGIAAHWKYKESGASDWWRSREDKRFRWLRQMLEWQQELKDSREFMDIGQGRPLPRGGLRLHPEGRRQGTPPGGHPHRFRLRHPHRRRAATASGDGSTASWCPCSTELNNGDIVEVITSPNQTPSKDWLKFVRTSKARNKIRHWVKAEQREKSMDLGRELLEKELRKYGFSLNRALGFARSSPAPSPSWAFRSADDLLAALGYGKLSLGQVIGRVVPQEKLKSETPKAGRIGKVLEKIRKKPSSAIKIQGVEDIMVRFAKCCNPLPGDPVIGFITRGRGVTVHTSDCPHVLEGDPERRIEVEWDMKKKASRPAKIRVSCSDQKGMLAGITGAITNCEANIISANVFSTPDHRGVNTFEVDVQDLDHLNRVINALLKAQGGL